MARQQIIRQPILKSLDEVNAALGELIAIEGRLATRKAQLDLEITALRDKHTEETKDDVARLERLKSDIEIFASTHRDTIFPTGRKSLQLPNGTLSFRLSNPKVQVMKKGRWTIPAVIEAIKEKFPRRASSWLRTKVELNKDVLVQADTEDLSQIGLEIVQEETFGIELNTEETAATANVSTTHVVEATAI